MPPCCDSRNGRRSHCRRAFHRAVLSLLLTLSFGSSPIFAQTSNEWLLRIPNPEAAQQASPSTDSLIQTAQSTVAGSPVRPVHSLIERMPEVQDELDVIERRSQLIVTRSNVVRTAVADPGVTDVAFYNPREIAILGLTRGSTTLTIWFEDSPEPLIYLVHVIRDPNVEYQRKIDYGKLEQKLALLFPNSKVYLIPMSHKIIVKGQARDAEEASKILEMVRGEVINQLGSLGGPQPLNDPDARGALNPYDFGSSYVINMLEVPGEHQVMLRVRIAELNRSQLRRLGVDLSYIFHNGAHAISAGVGGIPSTFTGLFEDGEIGVLLDWLASNGTAKILEETTLTVESGRQAMFHSGGEFAVPTIIGIGGAQGQQTSFRGFGTSVIVTPVVLDKDMVQMNVTPEFSQINQGNAVNGIPGLNSKRVTTTVRLREGQTLALGGLISHRTSTEVTRIPFLGDLPLIGSAFSAKRATQDENELLFLVTPELVRPIDADEVPPVPGFEVTLPTDQQLYRHNMTEGPPDTGVYQLPPYGSGAVGTNVGYQHFNPAPATPMYSPVPTAPYGAPLAPPGGGTYQPPYGGAPGYPGPMHQPPVHTPPYGGAEYPPSMMPVPGGHTAPLPGGRYDQMPYAPPAQPPYYGQPPAGYGQPPAGPIPDPSIGYSAPQYGAYPSATPPVQGAGYAPQGADYRNGRVTPAGWTQPPPAAQPTRPAADRFRNVKRR